MYFNAVNVSGLVTNNNIRTSQVKVNLKISNYTSLTLNMRNINAILGLVKTTNWKTRKRKGNGGFNSRWECVLGPSWWLCGLSSSAETTQCPECAEMCLPGREKDKNARHLYSNTEPHCIQTVKDFLIKSPN